MQIEKLTWKEGSGWQCDQGGKSAALILYFGNRLDMESGTWFPELQTLFPDAQIVGCSSASQIIGDEIIEDGINGVAINFNKTKVRAEAVSVSNVDQSRMCGEELGGRLAAPDLAGILLFSDGLLVNGSELINGFSAHVPDSVSISGGLAADGALFDQTLVGLNQLPVSGQIVAVGLYGPDVRLSTGSAGGWSEFGPKRKISRSDGNVLFELDDEPALDLYERYLGEEDAKELPSSGLLFPLRIFDPEQPEHHVVRTILAIDREARSMTFAGDMPQGWVAQLMRGNVDRLVIGAAEAAQQVCAGDYNQNDETLVLMVSCIGRRLLMGQRTVDEVEAVTAELGANPAQIGFYSYGEISPQRVSGRGRLHNQTMTITAISEAA